MTVTPDTVVVGVEPDITSKKFEEILAAHNSPAEPTARSGYQDVVRHKVSPAFGLAIFEHESKFGHEGLVPKHDLKNPGARRTTRTGEGKVIQIPGRGGFVKYPTWTAGWADLAFSLVDPKFVYAKEGLTTIRQIIYKWAPPSDNNDPENYIRAVVKHMNEWIGEDVSKAQVDIPGVQVGWHPADKRHHTVGRTHKIKQIVHHHTDGWNSLRWLTTSKNSNVSAHFLVNHEGTEIVQLVRLEDTAHTQGDHNPWSVGIEWERKWPDQATVPPKVYDTLSKLDAAIMEYVHTHNLGELLPTREYIKRHDEVNNTSCPQNLDVERIVDGIQIDNGEIEFDTGYKLQHGFADFYRSLGDDAWRVIGVPVGPELHEVINGDGLVTVQQTDVGWLQFNPVSGEVRMATRDQQHAIERDRGMTNIQITNERLRFIGEELLDIGNELMKA